MLDCTWTDLEAQIALRRMLLKEQNQQKASANNLKAKRKPPEAAKRILLKRVAGTAGDWGSF